MCIETVLTDEKKVWDNVKDAKLNSPDFKGMTPEEAMEVRLDGKQARPAVAVVGVGEGAQRCGGVDDTGWR